TIVGGRGLSSVRLETLEVQLMLLETKSKIETSLNQGLKPLSIKRLLNEIERRTADGPNELLVHIIDAAGHENDVQLGHAGFQPAHQLEPIHFGHADIHNRQRGIELERQRNGVL